MEPCQIWVPGIPAIDRSENFSDKNRIRLIGVTTFEMSARQALALADEMLKPVRQQLKKGRCQELLKLLATRPEFIDDPWIRGQIIKWIKTGRSFTKRGRRFGTFRRHPLIVVAAADYLRSTMDVPNKERAFCWLDERDWLDYDAAKKRYYQGIGEKRFRAVLIRKPVGLIARPRLKARRLIQRADRLRARQSITRTLFETPAGPVTMTITAT